jgi:hypothetical protein
MKQRHVFTMRMDSEMRAFLYQVKSAVEHKLRHPVSVSKIRRAVAYNLMHNPVCYKKCLKQICKTIAENKT